MSFDWPVFDEGFWVAVPFLRFLNLVGQRFVAEVPVNFTVREEEGGPPRRANARLTAVDARRGVRHRVAHRAVRASFWRVTAAAVWAAGREHALVVAINESTREVKYFSANAAAAPPSRVLAVAFRRWAVEYASRLGKQEAGLMGYEGRDYTGLLRHLTLSLIVLGFVATHTVRLRGNNPDVTAEQVCRALHRVCRAVFRRRRGMPEVRHTSDIIRYHQWRNARSAKSHKKRRHRSML